MTYRLDNNYCTTVKRNCVYPKNFCDGKPMTSEQPAMPPCPYRQNGYCMEKSICAARTAQRNGGVRK